MQPGELFDVGLHLGNFDLRDLFSGPSSGPDYALLAEILNEPSPPTFQAAQQATWPPAVQDGQFTTHYQLPQLVVPLAGQAVGGQHAEARQCLLQAQQHTALAPSGTAAHGRMVTTSIAPVPGQASDMGATLVSAEQEPLLLQLQCLRNAEQLQLQHSQQQQGQQYHQVPVGKLQQVLLQQQQQQQCAGEEGLQLQAALLQQLLQQELQDLQGVELELQQQQQEQHVISANAMVPQLQHQPVQNAAAMMQQQLLMQHLQQRQHQQALHEQQQQQLLLQQQQQLLQVVQPGTQTASAHQQLAFVTPFSGSVANATAALAAAAAPAQQYPCIAVPVPPFPASNSDSGLLTAASLGSGCALPAPNATAGMLGTYEQQMQQMQQLQQQQPPANQTVPPLVRTMQDVPATSVVPAPQPLLQQQQQQPAPQSSRSSAQTPPKAAETAAAAAAAAAQAPSGKGQRSNSTGKQRQAKQVQGVEVAAAVAAAAADAVMADDPGMSRFKRNRLRNKANMLQMEAEVERKLREMQLLLEENEQLKLKHQALQLVLAVRDSHVSLLKHYGPPTYPHSDAAAVARSLSLTGSHATTSGNTATTSTSGELGSSSSILNSRCVTADADSNATPEADSDTAAAAAAPPAAPADELPAGRCVIFTGRKGMMLHGLPIVIPGLDDMLEQGRDRRSGSKKTKSGQAKSGDARAGSGTGSAADDVQWVALLRCRLQQLSMHSQELPAVSVGACKEITVPQAILRYKHHVYTTALMLQQLVSAPSEAAAATAKEQLHEMIDHLGFNAMGMVVLNPMTMIRLCAKDMETGVEINPHELDQHWTAVVLGLQLTEPQQVLFLTIFELIARDLLAISRQRKKLFGEIVMATVAAAKARQSQVVGKADAAAAAAGAPPIPAALQQLMTAGAARGGAAGMLQQQMQHLATFAGNAGPELSPSMLEMLEKIQATVQREVLAAITLNATFVDHILDPVQVAKLHVLAYPIFPNTLGMAIAFAKHIGWRPKAGVMARGALTRFPRPEQQQLQPPAGSSMEAAATAAAAAASDSVGAGFDAASKAAAVSAAAAAAAAGSARSGRAASTRASARKQGSTLGVPGGIVSVSLDGLLHQQKDATAAAAASEHSQGQQQQQQQAHVTVEGHSACQIAGAGDSLYEADVDDDDEDDDDDDGFGPEMPDAVADMLTDVQSGRLAAATLILQATEQTVRVVAE